MWRSKQVSHFSNRQSPKSYKLTIAIFGLFVVSFIYYKVNLLNFAWYRNTDDSSSIQCYTHKEEMDELVALAKDTSAILDRLGVNHFLAYGSLWGGLRYNAPLPWDNDFDFGVMYSEIIKHSEQKLTNEFKQYGINCYYSYRFGFYRVTRGSARGDVMIYRDYYNTGWMHRIGWEAYAFFVNYRHYHMFPARLIRLPMRRVPFGTFNVSIPHGGVEIQKYHYPYDWWLVGKPRGCI